MNDLLQEQLSGWNDKARLAVMERLEGEISSTLSKLKVISEEREKLATEFMRFDLADKEEKKVEKAYGKILSAWWTAYHAHRAAKNNLEITLKALSLIEKTLVCPQPKNSSSSDQVQQLGPQPFTPPGPT